MDKSKVVARIQKLLHLADTAKNSNIEEAAAAAAKAQALMEKYRIKQAMLDTSSDEKTGWQPLVDKGKPSEWKIYLVAAISKYNGCYIVRSETYKKDNKIYLVGENSDIENVQQLYGYLVSELNRLCIANLIAFQIQHKYYPNYQYTNSFYLGAITTIETKLAFAQKVARSEEIKKATTVEAKTKLSNALARIDDKVQNAKDWIDRNIKAKIADIPFNNSDMGGYAAGQKAAKSVDLNPNRPELK